MVFLCRYSCVAEMKNALNIFITVIIALTTDSLWRKHRVDCMYVYVCYVCSIFAMMWSCLFRGIWLQRRSSTVMTKITTFWQNKIHILLFLSLLLIIIETVSDAFNCWLVQIISKRIYLMHAYRWVYVVHFRPLVILLFLQHCRPTVYCYSILFWSPP